MSLINEALKKAQRQRSLESAPLSSAPSGVAAAAVTTHVPAATRRRRSFAPVWFGLGLLVLGAGTSALVMRFGFAPAAPATPAAPPAPQSPPTSLAAAPAPAPAPAPIPAPAAAPAPEAPVPLVAFSPPPPVTSTPTVTTPSTPPPTPTPVPVATATPVRTAPVSVKPTSAPAAAPAAAPTPVQPVAKPTLTSAERDAQVYAFLNAARLTGVRGLDREARVLMNERVWRLNDIVSPELGLRLSAVRPNLLVFTDTQGRTYEKLY